MHHERAHIVSHVCAHRTCFYVISVSISLPISMQCEHRSCGLLASSALLAWLSWNNDLVLRYALADVMTDERLVHTARIQCPILVI